MKWILPLLLVLPSTQALAGGESGGGGKAVVCRAADNSIRSAELLDLFEGRGEFQLPYQDSPEDWQAQAERILEVDGGARFTQPIGATIYSWYDNAISHMTFVPIDYTLLPTKDSYEVVAPVGCAVEQAAIYQNDNQILISTEIWNAFSATQRAALLIHESTYRFLRDHGETDSRRARHFTAYLISGHHIEPTFPGNDYNAFCAGSERATVFYAAALPPDASGRELVRLNFASIGGRFLLSRSYLDVDRYLSAPGLPTDDFLAQLRNPTQSIYYVSHATNSLFEPGDRLDLLMDVKDSGKVQLKGTSIFDESKIPLTDMSCFFKGAKQ